MTTPMASTSRVRLAGLAVAAAAITAVVVPSASAAGFISKVPGYSVYSEIKGCLGNMDIGQSCIASDGANIRLAVKEIRDLRAEMQANQKQVNSQLNLLQKSLDDMARSEMVGKLNPVILNAPDAVTYMEGLLGCVQARNAGKPNCTDVAGRTTATATAIAGFKDVLSRRVGLMGDDILSTVAFFTGTDLGGDESGLVAKDWLLNKRQQDREAGVSDTAVASATKAPVVTAGLANSTTRLVTTVCDYLEIYGLLKPFVAGMEGRDAIAVDMQKTVQDAIYGAGPYSLVSRQRQFTMPALHHGQIAFIRKGDGKAIVVSPYPVGSGSRPLTPATVFELGTALNAYGRSSAFMKARPAAFPAESGSGATKGRWYPVSVPAAKWDATWDDTRSGRVVSVPVTQMLQSGSTTVTARMHLSDATPKWDGSRNASVWSQSYVKAGGPSGVSFKQSWNTFVKGPANFDWQEIARRSGWGARTYYGAGAWVQDAGTTPPGSTWEWKTIPAMMG